MDSQPLYTYFMEVQDKEHMLYVGEIAKMYGLTVQKTSKLFQKYIEEEKLDVPKLYYNTRNGLKRVYPRHIWLPAMEAFTKKEDQ
jgi:hypothetical protein